jgi:predicted HicB family RNase H-like nuclease
MTSNFLIYLCTFVHDFWRTMLPKESLKPIKKRIIAEIPEELHRRLKAHIAQMNISMKDYIVQAVVARISSEEQSLNNFRRSI